MLGLAALPTAWKVAGAALLALALVIAFGVTYAKGRSDGGAACKAAAAQAVIEAQQKADQLGEKLKAETAAKEAATGKIITVYRDKVNNAPSTTSCGPVVRDALDGLRAVLHGSGS